MTETLERDLTVQEQLNNAHDAEFIETIGHLNLHEVTQEGIPPVIPYEVKRGDGYHKIIKEAIFKKYYPELYKNCGKDLLDLIQAEIENDTNIKNSKLQEGQKLDIHTEDIKQIIDNYLNGREVTQEGIPPVITYEVKRGDGYHKIIKEAIFKKYYPELYQNCRKELLDLIQAKIEVDTNIKNAQLQEGQKLDIHTEDIKQIIDNYLNESGGNNGQVTTPEQETPSQVQASEQAPEEIPETLEYKVKGGDSISSIVKNELFKYYPQLNVYDKRDKRLTKKLRKIVEKANNNSTQLKKDQILTINMSKVTQAVQEYFETINDLKGYTTLTTKKQFEKSDDPVITKLRSDKTSGSAMDELRNDMFDKLSHNQKVKVPKNTENSHSPTFTAEEITRPDSAIMKKIETNGWKNKLSGRTFVLDAGHGETDPGTFGLVQDGSERVVMFESAIAMDMTYRTAQLLRACGATVELTHYVPNRKISNNKDLAPCLGLPDENENPNALYTDILRGKDKNTVTPEKTFSGKVGKKSMTYRRKEVTETVKKETGKVDMFMSLHMNSGTGPTEVMYETSASSGFATHLQTNGFGKVGQKTGYPVLHPAGCPAVLVEMGGIKSQTDAAIFRDPQKRQKKAEDLVKSMVDYDRSK